MDILANMQLVTKEIRLKNNELADGEFTISPTFTRTTGETADGRYYTELSVSLSNTKETPFPLDLYVCIAGIFELNNFDDEQIRSFLNLNAVQILFPYIRTIVSSITSTAMMPPIVLPIINSQTLFPDKDSDN